MADRSGPWATPGVAIGSLLGTIIIPWIGLGKFSSIAATIGGFLILTAIVIDWAGWLRT